MADEEIKSIDFEKLNDILKHYMSKDYSLYFSEKAKKLAEGLLEETIGFSYVEQEYSYYVSPQRAIDLVCSFFLSINPEYAMRFQNVLNERYEGKSRSSSHSIHFELSPQKKDLKKSKVYRDGFANIVLLGGVADIFSTMHESVHKIGSATGYISFLESLLCEVPTISLELELFDYLSGVCKNEEQFIVDSKNYIKWRFNSCRLAACRVFMECELLTLFKNNGHIDEVVLEDYFDSIDKNSRVRSYLEKYILPHIRIMIKYEKMYYPQNIRYVIGILWACDHRVRIEYDCSELGKVFRLDHLLGKTNDSIASDMREINDLGLSIFDHTVSCSNGQLRDIVSSDNFIELSDEVLSRLRENYRKVIAEFFDRQSVAKKDRCIMPLKGKVKQN